MRVHHERKSDGVRVDHEKKSEEEELTMRKRAMGRKFTMRKSYGVTVHHKKIGRASCRERV